MSLEDVRNTRLLVAPAVVVLAFASLLGPADAMADSYLGASIGQSGVEVDAGGPVQPLIFDEEDFAWKAYGGFSFDVALVELGIEGGYVDLGGPSGDVQGSLVEVDADGFDVFGVLGVELGPLGVFAKAGMIAWDASITVDGFDAGSDDGTDPAYGIGAKFGLGSLDLRVEYEIFDIEDAEDVTLLSAGLVWRF
jgi:outer membrane immunogenic protein